jgi:dihydropyrimidine dehydrogenase (NAD+) subunit PreT
MGEYKIPANAAEFAANFAQLKPLMNTSEAYYESARCLFCHDAPCMAACPTGIDIPLFIKQINSGNLKGSAQTIYASNFFGYACGKVCPTEVLCEGACVYNGTDMRPVDIGRLQSVATGSVIRQNTPLWSIPPANGRRVAVVGAGPAGIACACELRLHGYAVEVFEAKEKPSGLTIYGVAPYKITNEEALDEMAYLQEQFGFDVHYQRPIANATDLARLESEFDAVFLGIGLGATRSAGIPGEELEGVFGAVELIERLRMAQHAVVMGRDVVVIGGGNTAMDAASEAARMGARSVVLAYRKGKEDMSAYEFEYDLAKGVGVKGLFHVQPLEIVGDGKAEGVLFRQADGEALLLPCDMVIRATGQEKQSAWLSQIAGLSLDGGGRILTTDYRTTHPKYWAGGDAVNGGAEVVNAAAEGKAAGRAIHAALSGH